MDLRMFKSLREYTLATILTPTFMFFEVLMEVLIPLQMAKIIDIGIKNNDIRYIMKTGLILIVIALISFSQGILSGVCSAYSGAGFAKNLRKDMFYSIQNFSFKNIDNFSPSSLITRMTTDINNVQIAFMMSTRLLFRTLSMIALALYATYTINHRIGISFIIIAATLSVVLLSLVLLIYPIYSKAYSEYDRFNQNIQESITAIRVIKSFVRETFENEKFQKVSKMVKDLFTKAGSYYAVFMFAMQFSIYFMVILILLMGGKLIAHGDLQPGQLTSIVIFALQILFSIFNLSFIFVMVLISISSGKRITAVLAEKTEMIDMLNALDKVENGDISFENVSFSYSNNAKNALNNINIQIKSGQTIGIIGGTGTSKSTLVQLIPRLYDVTEGVLKVGGRDVREYRLETLRDEVSMVLQKNTLFTGTIAENIRWGNPNASDEEVIRVAKLAQADSFIQGFPEKYETQISQGGNNVSGGQKQRLCIARALLKKPKILILDDSTSAVDTKTDYLIKKAFKEEIPNTTKIIIAQRISSIEDADMIIVMENGEINGVGTHEELLANNEIYRENYESQVKGGDDNE